MRRLSLCLVLVFSATIPAPLLAETILSSSRVAKVTVYPWGASVMREVVFAAPEGVHELIVTDLPKDTAADTLRVVADGLRIGAVGLISGRLPVSDEQPRPAVLAAQAEVRRLEDVLRARTAEIAAIRLQVRAAEEQIRFLQKLDQGEAQSDTEALRELVRMLGEEVLAASQLAFAAEQDAEASERLREDDQRALERARQALDALTLGARENAALSIGIEANASGTGRLEITSFTPNASWTPAYDLRLTRGQKPELLLERGALVAQSSGEDWSAVELVLSTARPSENNAPSELWPWLRRIGPEILLRERASTLDMQGIVDSQVAVLAAAPFAESAELEMMGTTVTYRYGTPVDIRDGVDALRVRLDGINLAPTVSAEAVPLSDPTAYMIASTTNDSGEIMLPGSAVLFVDGAMVGQTYLPLVAAGADMRIGFGPIDGLVLTRIISERREGDRGILSKTNELREVATLKVENLTQEPWKIRVLDRVPYSEQEDLQIRYTATPPASETDVDGKRGILAWTLDIAPGRNQGIRLETTLSWPADQVLR